MKIVLKISGILLLLAAAGCLSMSLLSYWGYRSLLDGSPEKYEKLLSRGQGFLIAAGIAGLLGGLCLFLRKKML